MSTDLAKKNTWAVEFETMLVDLSGRPAPFEVPAWEALTEALDGAVPERFPYMQLKCPGHPHNPLHLTGYDVLDPDGNVVDFYAKGIGIRTPVCDSVTSVLLFLEHTLARAKDALRGHELLPAVMASHPTAGFFRGQQGPRHPKDWQTAQMSMTHPGMHIDVSPGARTIKGFDAERALQRMDYFAPAMACVSLNAPFRRGRRWMVTKRVCGKSFRAFQRSLLRPPAERRASDIGAPVLFDVAAFDPVHSLARLGGYMEVVMGLLLADYFEAPCTSPGVCTYNMIETGKFGFNAVLSDGVSLGTVKPMELVVEMLDLAVESLSENGIESKYINPFYLDVDGRRVPADGALEDFEREGTIEGVLMRRTGFLDADDFTVR